MTSPISGEFIGTMVLIVLGDGVVAGVLLKRSKAEASGWMVIATGWAFAVAGGVFAAVASGSKDAFIHPAFTLGIAISSGDYSKFLPFAVAQLAGAFVGAVLVWVHYLPHWKETQDAFWKLGVFCTAPAIRNFGASLISEIVGAFFLLFVTVAIFSKNVSKDGLAAGLGPYLAGSWFGPLGSRSAVLLDMRSIRRVTLVRALLMRFFRLQEREAPIGDMRVFLWLALLSARASRAW